MRNNWSVFNNLLFQYDPTIEYHNQSLTVIGSMNNKCQFCDAFKWKDEMHKCAVSIASFTFFTG